MVVKGLFGFEEGANVIDKYSASKGGLASVLMMGNEESANQGYKVHLFINGCKSRTLGFDDDWSASTMKTPLSPVW